jgi:hypothetical protein
VNRPATIFTTALAAIAAVTSSLAVAAGASASAAAPVVSPVEMVSLVDDTGVLTMEVPATWTDIDTAPGTNDDGTPMPWISASTDFAAYRETFDVPGAVFLATTYTTDLQSWIDRLGQDGPCATSVIEPYDDGALVGLHATYSQCGATGAATFHLLAANAGSDTTRTYLAQVQSTNPAEEAVVAPVLASLNVVGITQPATAITTTTVPQLTVPVGTTPGATVTLPDGTPLAPAAPPGAPGAADDAAAPDQADGPVFTPANSVVDGAVQVTDDSRTITVAVPPEWTQTATASVTGSDGQPHPQIAATSGDIAVFTGQDPVPTDFTIPGVRFVGRAFEADTEGLVLDGASGFPCTVGTPQPYADPVFTGHIVELTACGGTATRIFVLAANPADSAMTAVLVIQVPDADDTAFQTVLSSFDVARGQ